MHIITEKHTPVLAGSSVLQAFNTAGSRKKRNNTDRQDKTLKIGEDVATTSSWNARQRCCSVLEILLQHHQQVCVRCCSRGDLTRVHANTSVVVVVIVGVRTLELKREGEVHGIVHRVQGLVLDGCEAPGPHETALFA